MPSVSWVGTTGLQGRLALETDGFTGYPLDPLDDSEVTIPPQRQTVAVADAVPAAATVSGAEAESDADD